VGKNQLVAAAAVQLGPCSGRTLRSELRKYNMAGLPRLWIGKGFGLNTCRGEGSPACFYEVKVNLTSLKLI